MKKSASIFLLIVFLFNMAGIFGLFSYLKYANYEHIFKRDKNEINLVQITIPRTEKILWKEENEFVYEGNYYDVFSRSLDEKNYYFMCWPDTKENALCNVFTKYLTSHFDEQTAGKGDSGRNNVKVITQDFIFNTYCWQIEIPFTEIVSVQNSFSIPEGFCSVFSPPPELS